MITNKTSKRILAGVLVAAFAAGPTFADFLQPFFAEADSVYGKRSGDKCVGPGLTPSPSSTATHNTTGDDMWLSNNENVASIEFFLNSKYDLTNIYFWNYNETGSLTGRGVAEFTVQVSTNRGETWSAPTTGGTQNPAIAGGTAAETAQVLSMTASAVNAVRFNTVSNHNGDTGYTGIADVGFETTTALRSALRTNDYVANVTIEAVSSAYSSSVADNLINGSGFDIGSGTHSTAVGDMWMSSGSSDPTPSITFDLGDNHDLHSILIWNHNQAHLVNPYIERGAKEVQIEVASSEGETFTSLGTFTFYKGLETAIADFSQVVDLSGFAAAGNVRRVRFNILSNYGTEPYIGLSEVRFVREWAPGTMLFGR